MNFGRALRAAAWLPLPISLASWANVYRFVISEHSLPLPGLTAPVRVAQLSDLHYGLFIGRASVRRWVDAALAVRADLIVITGDFLDSSLNPRGHAGLLAELSRLRAPLGVYGVWGNHDWTSLNTGATRRAFAGNLREAGVRLINNAGLQLRDDLYLAGVDDWWFGEQDLGAALGGYRGGATVLLAHNPDYLPYVPARVDLTLTGHTHGGQVRLPGLGPVYRSTLGRKVQGWVRGDEVAVSDAEGKPGVQHAGALGFVSRGLGVTAVPLRLNCPPEVVVLDLLPA